MGDGGAMRHLAIGDIHGGFTALMNLAAFVPIGPDDLVITLGDYVDRGPDSRSVVDWLIARHRAGRLVAVRGNHEVMMLAARENRLAEQSWRACGGDATLASYARTGEPASLDDVPESHWTFFEHETRGWFETDTHFFVHANAYPEVALKDQPDYMLYWEKFDDPPPHESGKVMVCGHTPRRDGRPLSLGHAICIDTWSYHRDGWLTCLDVATGRYWQANRSGETRSGQLEPDAQPS
jgi:serine/threonine protein phosphatase 1